MWELLKMGSTASSAGQEFGLLTSFEAIEERIASESWRTATNRTVIYYTTLCALSTSTDTRILTLLIDARESRHAFWANNTFGATIWRASDKFLCAWTNRLIVILNTIAVWSARRGWARICRDWHICKEI